MPMGHSQPARLVWAVEMILAFLLWQFILWIVAPRAADGHPVWKAILPALLVIAALWIIWLGPRMNLRAPQKLRGLGSWRTCFLRNEDLRRSARNYALITVLGVAVVSSIRFMRPAEALPSITWVLVALRFGSYLLSGAVQTLVFFEFFQPRFDAVFGARGALCGTALVFSLCHIPNVPVMGLGLVAGYFWAREYLQRPNLLLLALSHAILGSALVLVAGIIPKAGPFYLNPGKHLIRALFPWWNRLVHGLW